MPAWQNTQLLRLQRTRIRLERQICRGEHVALRDSHEQRSGRDAVDVVGRVVGAEEFDAGGGEG